MSEKKSSAVVSFSGGLDSSFCLYEALERHDFVIAVSFDYNQKHRREIECAREIIALCAGKFGEKIKHIVVKIPQSLKFSGSSLLKGIKGSVDWKYDGNIPDTYVPMRNLIFANICASIARRNRCNHVYLGISSADHFNVPKITKDWFLGFILGSKIKNPHHIKYGHQVFDHVPDDLIEINHSYKEFQKVHRNVFYYNDMFRIPISEKFFLSCIRHFDGNLFREEIIPVFDFVVGYFEGSLWSFKGDAVLRLFNSSTVGPNFSDNVNCILEFSPPKYNIIKNENVEKYKLLAITKIYRRILKKDPVSGNGVIRIPLNEQWFDVFISRIRTLKTWKFLYESAISLNIRNIRGPNPPYPDCTPWFFNDLKNSVIESLDNDKISFHAPLLYRSKSGVIIESLIKKPFLYHMWSLSHTSYDGSYPPKLLDASSKLRANAFQRAHVPDPLIIKAFLEGKIKGEDLSKVPHEITKYTSIEDALIQNKNKIAKKWMA